MNIKIHWVKIDRFGGVKSAYLSNGKLLYPQHVGAVYADLRDITKRNNPHLGTLDVESCGAVYRIGGELFVCEGCRSKVFKPLKDFCWSLVNRHPVVAVAAGGVAQRSNLQIIDTH